MTTLRDWLRKEEIFDPDTEKVLTDQGINNPEEDFKTYTEAQFQEMWRLCYVQRVADLKDQKAKVRLEKRLKKLEKFWRKESGIKATSITNSNSKGKKKNTNTAQVEDADLKKQANDLKKFLQKNQCYAADLLLECAKQSVFTEEDLNKVTNETFDEIYRQVRVQRAQDLKDQKSQVRMEKLMTKFEKLWRDKTGIKKTSQTKKTKKAKKKPAPKEQRNAALNSGDGAELRNWLKKNQIWEKELFDQLMARNITDEAGLKSLDEDGFDTIVRQVRVEKFKNVNDQKSRNRVDKLLISFEKIWRTESGIKKTSIQKGKSSSGSKKGNSNK